MKPRRLLFLTLIIPIFCFSQDLKLQSLRKLSIESLKILAKKREKATLDTNLVNIYSVISAKSLYVNNADAKKFSSLVLKLSNKLNYKHGLASGTNDLALVYLTEGDVNRAYKMLNSNLNYYYSVKDYVGLGTNYLNIGIVHGTQNEITKAIDNINKAIFFYKKGKANSNRLAGCYSMLGNAYSYLNDEEKTIKNYRTALTTENDDEDIISILNNLGKAYADFKKYDSAMFYYKKAISKNEKIKSSYDQMNSLHFISDLYLKTNKPIKAIEYSTKSLKIAEKENHLENKILNNKYLSDAYLMLGDYKNSLSYHKKYTDLKDSLNSKSSIDEVKKIEAKFELERQDAKVALLENQKKLHQAELKKSKTILLLGTIVLFLFIILSWYWYKRHQIKSIINLQQKEQFKTVLKLKEVESTLEGQLIERKRLAQELHDGLGASLAGIKLSVLNHFSGSGEKNESLIKDIDSVCNDVRLMSHNLIPPEFSKDTFEQIIKRLIHNYGSQTQTKLYLNIDGGKDLEKMTIYQKTLLYRILQETVTNAFKHANCSSFSLLITAFEDYITIIVEDNGIGFDTTKQTEGIGLKNIRERIKDLNSYLTIDSSPGRGTVLQFDIPL